MALITLKDYAERLGKNPVIARQKAIRGGFQTARKIGRDWFIDEDEPYTDNRVKSGEYKDWRKNMKIKSEPVRRMELSVNTFGQSEQDLVEEEYVTVTGTLDELLEYSKEHDVYIRRSDIIESLFTDSESKYVILSGGKVSYYADKLGEISGHDSYTHKGVAE